MKSILLFALSISFVLLESGISTEKTDKSIKKFLDKTFAFVPSGKAYVQNSEISVQSFYISKTEVTNSEYQAFLTDLKLKGERKKLQICFIDSSKWNSPNSFHEPYATHYHSHIAYAAYPVVNISHEGAKMYCVWLNEKYDKQFGTNGKFKFRLMEKAEYVRASRSDSQSSYSWKNSSLHNAQGQTMCNFTQLGSEDIHRNEESGKFEIKFADREFNAEFSDILAPSKSYWPNEFGIYNMNGNAAEMISEFGIAMGGSWKDPGYDVRVESERKYDQANPTTGFRVVMTYAEPVK